MSVIREFRIIDHIEGLSPLLAMNWEETGFGMPLDPQWLMMDEYQQAGAMFALGVFDGDRIVGYSSAFLTPHTFSASLFCCHSDALYVLPEYRSTGAGARLIIETELIAKARGANRMLWHTRAGTPLAAVLEKRGYLPADIVVMKEI